MISSDAESTSMSNYLTMVALEDGLSAKLTINDCEYCINGVEWISLPADTYTPSVSKGDTLSFRGNITPDSTNGVGRFYITGSCNLTGNCMSLVFGDYAHKKILDFRYNCVFYYLFADNTAIVEVSEDFLPSTYVPYRGYGYMFRGCTNLVKAPRLMATDFDAYCYYWMFDRCSSLVDVQDELPAQNLSPYCYSGMFDRCSSLVVAPKLNATYLASDCYNTMFQHCTSLITAPELNATTVFARCYKWMFYGCTNLKNVPEVLPATVLATECYHSMFYGTAITSAPALPAKSLVSNCYSYMLNRCANLKYIKALFTTAPSSSYTNYWVTNVASSGTFVKSKDATWDVRGQHGIPNNWTVITE